MHKTMSYRGFAAVLGALSLIAVACSDDDDKIDGGNAGTGGSSAGSAGSGAGSGGKNTSGSGGSSAGTGNTAGNGSGGNAGMAGEGGDGGAVQGGAGHAGDGQGGESQGGESQGGDGQGGQAQGGDGEGGSGGEAPIVADTLDNGTFSAYDAGWSESGDGAAGVTKWIHDEEPGLNHYSANAFTVATFQTVSPLPNGTYRLTAEVQKANSLNEQYLFAKGCKAGEPDTQVTAPTTAAGEAGYTLISLAGIEVSSGSCTVGIYTDGPAGGWSNIDNIVFAQE
jgi:hypothetical protein